MHVSDAYIMFIADFNVLLYCTFVCIGINLRVKDNEQLAAIYNQFSSPGADNGIRFGCVESTTDSF